MRSEFGRGQLGPSQRPVDSVSCTRLTERHCQYWHLLSCSWKPVECENGMNTALFREMQPRERELIAKLLEPEFPGRNELSQQLESAKVRIIDNDQCLEFLITCTVTHSHVKYAVPTEGEYEDPDGITVHLLLHMLGDKVKELEFYREDNAQVQTWPDPASVRVFAPQ